MKKICAFLLVLIFISGCNYVPAEIPEVYTAATAFTNAVETKTHGAAWGWLAPSVQGQLNEQEFKDTVTTTGDITKVAELFRNAGINTRTAEMGGEIKSEYLFQLTDPGGTQHFIRMVMAQEGGVWLVVNVIVED